MELLDYFWKRLEPAEAEGIRTASESLLEESYQRGLIDTRKFSVAQWKSACQKFAKGAGHYAFKRENLDSLKNYFFQGEIKKPFDPRLLKEGPRPLAWTGDLYQKVLRFETALNFEAWRKIVQTQILPKYKKGETILYNPALKEFLASILEQHPSPLRRLELWYHFEREQEATSQPKKEEGEISTKASSPTVIKDAFVAKPDETLKRTAIDKLYFHHGETPATDDQENLDFLDDLASWEDKKDGEL